jgi:adenosylhomocysteinase
MTGISSQIADKDLRDEGRKRLDWARTRMPILSGLKNALGETKPFSGLKIGICLHVEPKTGVWLETLTAAGAEIAITGSPGTTDDSTAAVLADHPSINVFARRDETFEDHLAFARTVLETKPDLIADNGADLHFLIESEMPELKSGLIGATEETTSGGYRLREDIAVPPFPTIVINDSRAKRVIENRYGVGQSVVDAIMRTTNILIGGLKTTVIGYGYCGRGVALCFKNLGARVTVVELDPLKRLDALLEGFDVAEKDEALSKSELVVTVTGRNGTLTKQDLANLNDGTIVANAGHFEFEIDVEGLNELSGRTSELRDHIDCFELATGKKIFLLGKGRPINLSAGDGNPIEVMDLGLALQTLSLKYLVEHGRTMENGAQNVPAVVECEVSELAFEVWK